jgi:hypothetical protein
VDFAGKWDSIPIGDNRRSPMNNPQGDSTSTVIIIGRFAVDIINAIPTT